MKTKSILLLFVLLVSFLIIDMICGSFLEQCFNTMHRGREYLTKKAIKEVSPSILFIGASQCGGNYKVSSIAKSLETTVFNAGMGAQHIDYQLTIAESVISRNKPDILVWDFDPKLFSDDNEAYLKSGLNPYYNCSELVKSEIDRVDDFAWFKHLFKSYQFNSLSSEILFYNLGSEDDKLGYQPFECNHTRFDTIDNTNYPPIGLDFNRKYDIAKKSLKRWKREGIRVIVLVSPIHAHISETLWGVKEMHELCDKMGVEFHDFSQLKGISDKEFFFRDYIHLCDEGANVYTNYIIKNVLNSNDINSIN